LTQIEDNVECKTFVKVKIKKGVMKQFTCLTF
jgi:hypothetical protein